MLPTPTATVWLSPAQVHTHLQLLKVSSTSCVDQRMDQYLDCTPGTWTHHAVKENKLSWNHLFKLSVQSAYIHLLKHPPKDRTGDRDERWGSLPESKQIKKNKIMCSINNIVAFMKISWIKCLPFLTAEVIAENLRMWKAGEEMSECWRHPDGEYSWTRNRKRKTCH